MAHTVRQYPRYAVDATVTFSDQTGEVASGRTDNVSRGGMCAITDRPLRPGSHVVASIALVFDAETQSEPLQLPSRVVWCTAMGDEHQIGCAFLPLRPDQHEFLEMFLRYLEEGGDDEAADDPDDPEDPFAS